jgi:hypothetical protein
MSSQDRAARLREWARLPFAVLQSIQKDLNRAIKARKDAPMSDTDVASAIKDPTLIHSIGKEIIRRGKRHRLQQFKVYCSKAHCPRCPHGPYWFLLRYQRSQNRIVARVHAGPALPRELIAQMEGDLKPATPYAVNLDPKKDRAWFERKVAELKTELEKLPVDRQEQLKRELESEGDREQ